MTTTIASERSTSRSRPRGWTPTCPATYAANTKISGCDGRNGCPGDIIETRVIEWGPVSAGMHTFVLDVPDAEFAEDQGNFPVSLYLQTR